MRGARALSALALWLATWGLPSSASAQDVESYTVREGDTCASIAERYYGSPRRYDRIHAHNPGLGPLPHHLTAGMVLELPLPRESSADATVTDARGSVRTQLPTDPGWTGAHIGAELHTGSRVSTGERSSAELTFRSSTVAAIRAETLVIVHGGSVERVREEGSRAVLREGSLLSRLSALSGGAPLLVETPAAEVEVSEGEAVVHVGADGATGVSAQSGRSAFVRENGASDTEVVEVPVGHGTHVRRGERPAPPRRLPTPPEWAAGEPRSFLGVHGVGGTLSGSWLPAEHAARYHVEIARREDGRDLVFQADVPVAVTRFEAYGLPPGRYYVRVASIDDELLEGRPASATVFEIVGVRFLRPGEPAPEARAGGTDLLEELDALSDTAFVLEGPPPVPEALVGSRVVVPEGVVCAEGTSEPSHELVLAVPHDTFLTCVTAGGENVVGVDLRVVAVRASVLAADGSALGALARDRATAVRIVLEGDVDPGGLVVRGEGLELTPTAVEGADLSTTLTPSAAAGERGEIVLALRTAPDVVLGRAAVPIAPLPAPPEPEPEPVAPTAPPPVVLHEGLGLFATPSWVGLRDEQRTGVGGTLGVTVASARLGEPDPRLRLVAGATAGLASDYLRISVTAPLDVIGQASRSVDRGARDLFVSLGSRLLSTADGGGAGLALEVGLWAPTAGALGLDRGRLAVAADFSLRFAERLALRTRQSGIFDLTNGGSMLWASAYGFDVGIVEHLSAGIEGTMTIGREDGRDWYAGGVGLGVGIDVAPVVISIAGRYGFGDDLWPAATIAANVRASFDP